MNRLRIVAASIGFLAAASMATANSAGASTVHPDVIGGSTAPSVPWGAQIFWDDQSAYGGFECSGTIIASRWVMTAQHCLNDPGIHVRVGSNTRGSGTLVAVDQQYASPNGDISLLHLASAVSTTYMRLGGGDPAVGDTNKIYGWGSTQGYNAPASQLKTANVQVTGQSSDAFGGRAIASQGEDGSAWHGDSGGPQVANGVQVGVCSTGENDGYDTQGTQNYASVAASRSWIRSTAGV